MNKVVVYTCIIGDYDNLIEVINPETNIDYICFSDSPQITKTWKVIQIPNELNLVNSKLSRYPKIMPHLFLKDYDISIYIDGRVSIIGSVNEFINETLKEYNLYVCRHPDRNCLYKESKILRSMKVDVVDIIDEQINKYQQEGFPNNFGLTANGLLLRRHNEEECIKFNVDWWNEVVNHSKRDQLSFMYSSWKNPEFKFGMINWGILFNSKYFKLNHHNHYKK